MVALRFEFIAGRYHATPWGHHVNEGHIEWPPSPWRLLRALLAVGFNTDAWPPSGPSEQARALVNALSSVMPAYVLPAAASSHTRHYMPIGGKTAKVFDAFAHVGAGPLWVDWPAQLEPESRALLERIAPAMAYLGRAESWVQCTAHKELPAELCINAAVCAEGDEAHELVPLLAPLTPQGYDRWRGPALRQASEGLSKAKRKAVESMYPPDLAGALVLSTAQLQKAGWARPPAARLVSYGVPADALSSDVRPPGRLRARKQERMQFALLAVTGDSVRGTLRPRCEQSLPLGELLHFTLNKHIEGRHCPELTGKTDAGERLTGHRHAHLCPLDLDGDGRLDHLLIWAPMGLGDVAREALAKVRYTYDRERGRWAYLTLAGFGGREQIHRVLGGGQRCPLAESKRWQSKTPFVAPRYLKASGRNDLVGQVAAELQSRGLPPATVVVGSKQDASRGGFFGFVRARRGQRRAPPQTRPWFLTLQFEQPVSGPLLLGYGSHFGLGQFAPVADPAAPR